MFSRLRAWARQLLRKAPASSETVSEKPPRTFNHVPRAASFTGILKPPAESRRRHFSYTSSESVRELRELLEAFERGPTEITATELFAAYRRVSSESIPRDLLESLQRELITAILGETADAPQVMRWLARDFDMRSLQSDKGGASSSPIS